jgi:CRISPR/Cas system-associated protein Csx1
MVDKKHVESILKINGLGTTAPDEQIRSVLLSARFNKDEVDAALMVLRENTKTNATRVEGLHKVFRTDQGLQASEISQLLGIEVQVTEKVEVGINARRYTLFQVITLWFISAIIATTAVLFYMYTNHTGVFHPSSSMSLKK